MFEWQKINLIEDEEVLNHLGLNRVVMRGEGYYVKRSGYELYVLTVGNGVIIQFHNCSYVYAIVKRISNENDQFDSEQHPGSITTYAVQEAHGVIDEREWLQKYKTIIERDFS